MLLNTYLITRVKNVTDTFLLYQGQLNLEQLSAGNMCSDDGLQLPSYALASQQEAGPLQRC